MNFAALSFIVALFIFEVSSEVSTVCDNCVPYDEAAPVCAIYKYNNNNYNMTIKNKEILDCEIACGGSYIYQHDGNCETPININPFHNDCDTCKVPLFPHTNRRAYCVKVGDLIETYGSERHAYCHKFCNNKMELLYPGGCKSNDK